MEYRTLGRTGLSVSRLGLGGAFVSAWGAELAQGIATVRAALDLGVNIIDTAPMYSNSEEVLGQALDGVEQPVIISTKFGYRPQPFDARDAAGLRASFTESLRLLKRDHIDMLLIHEPDRPGLFNWWEDWQLVTGPVLDVLEELKREGLIRFIGLGGTTVYEMAHLCRSGKFDVVLTAFNSSILWREAFDTVMPAAKEQGMGVIAASPLQQGALTQQFAVIDDPALYWLSPARREQFKRLYAFTDACGIPLPELALRFVISQPRVDCVLMGPNSPEQVASNAAAVAEGPLSADILAELDTIAAMVPYRPFEEPFGIGWALRDPAGYRGPGEA